MTSSNVTSTSDSTDATTTPAPTPTPESSSLSVFPAGLAEDLEHLQSAIDIKFFEDMAACLQAKGWPTDEYDNYLRATRKRTESGELPPEQDMFQDFIERVGAAETGASTAREAVDESSFMVSDAYRKADADCLRDSPFNIDSPFGDESALVDTWYETATELTKSDPRVIAAKDQQVQCLRESGTDPAKAYTEAYDTVYFTEEEWNAGSISGAEAIARVEQAEADLKKALDAAAHCDDLENSPELASIYDSYLQEVALESPNYAAAVQELTAFIDGYRDILDELNPPD